MDDYRVLILEDDPLVSSNLESIVADAIETEIVIGASIAEARAAFATHIDFALLDVDVIDGTTYDFAAMLSTAGVPFAFVSASDRSKMPEGLRNVPFVTKPYCTEDIVDLLTSPMRFA